MGVVAAPVQHEIPGKVVITYLGLANRHVSRTRMSLQGFPGRVPCLS